MDLSKKKHIVILTGAGISAESGIKTFRDSNGLWENHHIQDVATPEGFKRNPNLVYSFYNQRREQLFDPAIFPNSGHKLLSVLEDQFEGDFLLITQNVDNLHEKAGSKNVLHMHGELTQMRCLRSDKVFQSPPTLDKNTLCECCDQPSPLRPHIVWFGEMPLYMDQIQASLISCDLFISIGTSGAVYPAAGFVEWSRSGNNCTTIEVNLEKTQISNQFDFTMTEPASTGIKKILEQIIGPNNNQA